MKSAAFFKFQTTKIAQLPDQILVGASSKMAD
jgi:hypothetical protein